MALINSLCAMLLTSPFHRENYSRLILGVIIQFYQRCSDRFQDLAALKRTEESKLEAQLALPAQWAQRSELHSCLSEILACVRRRDFVAIFTNIAVESGHIGTAEVLPSRDRSRAGASWHKSHNANGPNSLYPQSCCFG